MGIKKKARKIDENGIGKSSDTVTDTYEEGVKENEYKSIKLS